MFYTLQYEHRKDALVFKNFTTKSLTKKQMSSVMKVSFDFPFWGSGQKVSSFIFIEPWLEALPDNANASGKIRKKKEGVKFWKIILKTDLLGL